MVAAAHALRVVACEALTPRMRRITCAGADPVAYRGPAMHLRLMLPPLVGSEDAVARYYTVRRLDAARQEIVIDAVLHRPEGPGSAWATRARPGDALAALGPVGRPVPDEGRLILIGDETALPIIARLIEEAAPTRRIDALVEVADAGEEQPIAAGPGTRLRWLHRGPGGASTLAEAAAGLDWDDAFVYAGVEARTAQALRACAVERCGPGRHRIVAYWHRQGVR